MTQQAMPNYRISAYTTWADYLEISRDWTNEKRDSETGKKVFDTLEKFGGLLSQWQTSNVDDTSSIESARYSLTVVSRLLKKDDSNLVKKARMAAEEVVFGMLSRFAKQDLVASTESIFQKRETA
jgi:hypothetical protein